MSKASGEIRNLLNISDQEFLADLVRCRLEAFERWQGNPDNQMLKLNYEF